MKASDLIGAVVVSLDKIGTGAMRLVLRRISLIGEDSLEEIIPLVFECNSEHEIICSKEKLIEKKVTQTVLEKLDIKYF